MTPPQHIAILGGGLTGLTTAHLVSRRLPSAKVTLFESSTRLGGWIDSSRHAIGFKSEDGEVVEGQVILEGGPRSIRPRGSKGAAAMLGMIQDLALGGSLMPIRKSHPSAKNRFILTNSTTSRPILTPLRLNPLNPLGRQLLPPLLAEPFRSRSSAATATEDDESVHDFILRRFGPHVANLASAGLHGIYAASTTELSARAVLGGMYDAEREYGSVILGLIRRGWNAEGKRQKAEEAERWASVQGGIQKDKADWAMYGLRGGLGSLVNALRDDMQKTGVDIRLREGVDSIVPNEGGVEITTGRGTFQASRVISTLPPILLPPLIRSPNTTLPHLGNTYTSVGVISLVYPLPPSAIHPAGFGYLIPRPLPASPRTNPSNILGVIFDSTALPGLDSPAVEGKITKLTVMMGGPYWSTYPAPGSDIPAQRPSSAEELLQPALDHLHSVFPKLKGIEPVLAIPRLHKDCIPTYSPGHYARLADLHHAIEDGPWGGKLSLAGNGYGGVGVNDCVWSAQGVVDALAAGKQATGLERWARVGAAGSLDGMLVRN